ncbi:MAG: AsmA-like C-terminal domain-containing protein [Sulfurimonas sp.]|uniref:YhdP family protein n=1 Tax=Sulfurimonas sp. TaxID=2022749 RepID=UPI0026016D22|nr:AsmA-like C-terminal domain-containing protein [Sulfurimonas sp.]MDD2652580.1 AsmA-like C-terminal domain-containing protein [Sulfurimonas sp.]MDD3450722.1 AsmA-like C-terminal domain-containing protein [Sulfurimonas sp.]
MNDKMIINAISKIQFAIVTILSFILLLLLTLFIFLQHGIFVKNVSFSNIKAEELYIKWDEKITLHVKEITLTNTEEKDDSLADYQVLLTSLKPKLAYLSLFQEISLDKVAFGNFNLELKYSEANDGFIKLYSPDVALEGLLTSNDTFFHLLLQKCEIINKGLKIDGDIIFTTKGTLELTTALKVTIQDETVLKLYTHSDREKLHYAVESEQKIKNIKQIVSLFDFDQELKYWVDDAIVLSSLELKALYGWLEYEKMKDAYLNIYAKAVANDLIYTYDTKVAPIRTKMTDLEFKNGVLFIRPQNAYSYDFFLDKSWLKIDFTTKEELLTLHLLFKGQANKDLLHLLNNYEIKLPFVQTKGMIDTDLTLEINLMTLDVEAVGDFYAKESQINYLGLDIDILDAHVMLKNSDVKVKDMKASYKDIATATVALDLQAKKSIGKLDFAFDTISFADKNLSLAPNEKPLGVTYFIDEKQDYLKIAKSRWNYKEHIVDVDAAKVLFDIKNLEAKIPSTNIKVQDTATATLLGDVSFKSQEAFFDIALLSLDYNGVSLNKAVNLKTLYKDGVVSMSAQNPFMLRIDKKNIDVHSATASLLDDGIWLEDAVVGYEDSINAKLSAKYNSKSGLGAVDIQELYFQNEAFEEIFSADEKIELAIKKRGDALQISSSKYGVEYLLDDKAWHFKVASLEYLAKKSKLLQKYGLINGQFRAQKKSDEDELSFSLDTDYKHKIIIEENKPVESYSVVGAYDTKTGYAKAKINNLITIDLEDTLKIKANDLVINIDEVINIFDSNDTDEDVQVAQKEQKTKSLPVSIQTTGCSLYLSENRSIISDSIYFTYNDEMLHGELKHQNGKANFLLREKKFYLMGGNFNDLFMENLFANSKFKGGEMEFYISGPLKEYDGTIHIKDTTILDYKILNNVLAFVNTVPSLITFSLPGYNINGIKTKEAYMKFKLQDEKYKISDIYLNSKEIEIVGAGEASIKENSINLDLNLKTQLGSSFSKIPLIGHILLGNESVSTSLHITGALDNPDVKTQLTKDIVVAPFNIIKRTLMYPFELLKSQEEADSSTHSSKR